MVMQPLKHIQDSAKKNLSCTNNLLQIENILPAILCLHDLNLGLAFQLLSVGFAIKIEI
jgi:hypothetical protein